MNYKFIVDPITGKKEYTRSKKGRHILFKYLNQVGGAEAAASTDEQAIVWEQEGRQVEAVDVINQNVLDYISQAENKGCSCTSCVKAAKKKFDREEEEEDDRYRINPYGYETSQGIEHHETAEDLEIEDLDLSRGDIEYLSESGMGDFICSRKALCNLVRPYLNKNEKKNTIDEQAFQRWMCHHMKLKDTPQFREVVECFLKFHDKNDYRCEAKPGILSSFADLFK